MNLKKILIINKGLDAVNPTQRWILYGGILTILIILPINFWIMMIIILILIAYRQAWYI